MLWRINFVIDNGYDWKKHNCVVVASNEDDAECVFEKWITPRLSCEEYVMWTKTTIEPIDCSDGVVYQNVFMD